MHNGINANFLYGRPLLPPERFPHGELLKQDGRRSALTEYL